MKIAVIILVIALGTVTGLYFVSQHQAQTRLDETTVKLAASQTETAGVKTELKNRADRVSTLEKSLQTSTAETAAAVQENQQLKTQVGTLQQSL